MRSIKSKFALILGVIVFVVCMGLVTVSYMNAEKAITTVAEDLMVQMVSESSKVIEEKINYQYGVMVAVANTEFIRDKNISIEEKLDYLNEVAKREGFNSFGIGDTAGKTTIIGGVQLDLSERDYYQNVLKGNMAVTDPIISKADGELIVNYAVPIKDKDQKVIGVLIGSRSGNELSNMTNDIKIADTGNAYMVNGKGTIVAHYVQDMVLNQDNAIDMAKEDPKLQKLADIVSHIIKGETGFGSYSFGGAEKLVAYTPVGETGWYLAISVPEKEILSTLDSLKTTSIGISILFFLIGLIVVYFIAGYITSKIKSITKQLNTLSTGDFSQEQSIKVTKNRDEIGEAHHSLQIMQDSVRDMIKAIQLNSERITEDTANLSAVSEQMANASENISFSIQETGKGINSQAEGLAEINQTISSFGEKIEDIVKNIEDVDANTIGINQLSTKGDEDMKQLIDSVHLVNHSFADFKTKIEGLSNNIGQVTEITTVIDGIAEQTNLLSLNAAIEAARAGESGKGFAVVAAEIGKLAEQSQRSSRTIDTLITSISGDATLMINTTNHLNQELDKQIEIIKNAIESYRNIITELSDISSKIQVVNTAAGKLNQEKVQILDRISDASSVSEEVAASGEEIAAATEELTASSGEVAQSAANLRSMTQDMLQQVGKFKV